MINYKHIILEYYLSSICIIVDTARMASTTPNMDAPNNYQTTYDSKNKIVVFYSLINCMIKFKGSVY